MEAETRPTTLARVTADGVELAWPLVELFGHGRLRRLLTSFARTSGRPLPDGLGQLVDVIDGAARARSVVGSDGRSCWVDRNSEHEQLRHAPTVSVAEAAELLGIGDEGVRQRIRRHRLAAWRDDAGRWRIPRAELPNHDEQQA